MSAYIPLLTKLNSLIGIELINLKTGIHYTICLVNSSDIHIKLLDGYHDIVSVIPFSSLTKEWCANWYVYLNDISDDMSSLDRWIKHLY